MVSRPYSGKIGFCIGADIERPPPQIFEQLKNLGTPALADGLNKFNVLHPQVKPVAGGLSIAGPAFTVRLRPGDNLMLHKAIGLAQPGDIIVVDTCGCKNYCVMGDLMACAAFKKGIGGFVIDGGIRDVKELQQKRFPIFARYIVPAVGDKEGPGEINMPISCAGVPVLPGDYIAADDNGVVVIPPYLADDIIKGAVKKLDYEDRRAVEIEEGVVMKPDIDEKLKSLGIIDCPNQG